MKNTITRIGPADHGRKMSLEEFDYAEEQEGYVYELSRGVVTVSDVPKRIHLLLVSAIRDLLQSYKANQPGRIHVIAAGNECKLIISDLDSERHPEISIYQTPPPDEDSEDFWSRWVPEIVIEVVCPSSRTRDYQEKPEEYLRCGVKEYWIVDADERHMVVMTRSRGRRVETTIRPPAIYRARSLAGLEFSIAAVFTTAGLG